MNATMNSLSLRLGAICAFAALACQPVMAATINYGDFEDYADGGIIVYQDVTEGSATSAIPLYGAPSIDVNQLDFDPIGFGAIAGGANGSPTIVDGQLNFSFETLPGSGIDSLLIEEGGDYSFIGSGASVGFGIFAKLTVTEVNGVALAPTSQFNVIGSVSNSANSPGGFVFNTPWSQGLLLDLGPALASNGFLAGSVVTAGEVTINDTLGALAQAGSSAFIAKKDFVITPGGDLTPDGEIPEPSTAILVVAGLLRAGFRRRR